jgi:hypothetical protein
MPTSTLARDTEIQLLRIDQILLRYTAPRPDVTDALFFDLPDGPAFHNDTDVIELSDIIEGDNEPWPFAVYPDEVWH